MNNHSTEQVVIKQYPEENTAAFKANIRVGEYGF